MDRGIVRLMVEAQNLIGREPYEWGLVYILVGSEVKFSWVFTDEEEYSVLIPEKLIQDEWFRIPRMNETKVLFIHNHTSGEVTPSPSDLLNALRRLNYFRGSDLYQGIVGKSYSLLYMPRTIKEFHDVFQDTWRDSRKGLSFMDRMGISDKVLDLITNPNEKEVELKQNEEWEQEATEE